MDSKDLAKYIEAKDGISQPWLLVQLRHRFMNLPPLTRGVPLTILPTAWEG